MHRRCRMKNIDDVLGDYFLKADGGELFPYAKVASAGIIALLSPEIAALSGYVTGYIANHIPVMNQFIPDSIAYLASVFTGADAHKMSQGLKGNLHILFAGAGIAKYLFLGRASNMYLRNVNKISDPKD